MNLLLALQALGAPPSAFPENTQIQRDDTGTMCTSARDLAQLTRKHVQLTVLRVPTHLRWDFPLSTFLTFHREFSDELMHIPACHSGGAGEGEWPLRCSELNETLLMN